MAQELDNTDVSLDVVADSTLRVLIDDVSGGHRTEFRASFYDEEDELVGEGWGKTLAEATAAAAKQVYA